MVFSYLLHYKQAETFTWTFQKIYSKIIFNLSSGVFISTTSRTEQWRYKVFISLLMWISRNKQKKLQLDFTFKHLFTVKIHPHGRTTEFRSTLRNKILHFKPPDKVNPSRWRETKQQSLLLLAFGFSVHHFSETRQDLALAFPPLLLVEGGQSSLFIRAVDLVLLSQTHSLHTTMSAGGKKIRCQRYRRYKYGKMQKNGYMGKHGICELSGWLGPPGAPL